VIRTLRSLSVGFLVACILLVVLRLDNGVPGWWLPTAAVVAALTVIVAGIATGIVGAGGSTLRPTPSDAAIEAAEREGRLHLARVLDISSTGTRINDNPVAELRLVVATTARPAYSTRTRALIDQVRLPQFQPGNVVVVLQEKADGPAVTLVQSPPQSWRDKAADDTRVGRMDHAPEWTAEPSRVRDTRGFLRIPAVVLVLLLVVGFAARLYPVRSELGAVLTGTPLADVVAARTQRVDRENSTVNPARAQEVVDDFVAEVGHSNFTSVRLGALNASATMPTAPGANTTDDLTWRDGRVTDHEPSLIQPRDDELPLRTFDAADVDWASLQELADRLPEQAGFVPESAPTVYVSVPMFDEAGLPYEIDVSASSPYHDASVTYGPDGTVLTMYGGADGSEIAEWEAAQD
jgi:hypothetical protein